MLLLVWCGCGWGQTRLQDFLHLTPAQVTQVLQLNAALDDATAPKIQRINTVNQELQAEYAKASPDAAALGLRYVELDSLSKEIAAAQAATISKVRALLDPSQTALVQQISAAMVQASLLSDASCVYLGAAPPQFAFLFGNASVPGVALPVSGNSFASLLLGYTTPYGTVTGTNACSQLFPISVRNYLALTDAEVSAIQAIARSYEALAARKQARATDVQVEIRDETAKAAPDPVALGVRYAELLGISQELSQADQQGRVAARAVLTAEQKAKLQVLNDGAIAGNFSYTAQACRFLVPPAGSGFTLYIPAGRSACPPNF